MVFKNLARFLINKYLKDYIEELEFEKFKLDLVHGKVSMESLRLKPEALADLSLPVTVAAGYIDKLTLIISWRNPSQHPTKVSIDGFYMLIVPKNEDRRDFTEYYQEKLHRVERKVENLRKMSLNHKKPTEKEYTLFEKMRLQIMQNLEITIDNLHLSYETYSTTKLGHPFSFGLTIHHLEMMTTTNERPIGRIKEHSLVIFKMKQMRGLALYWNTQCQSRVHLSFEEILSDLQSKISTENSNPVTHEMNYILYPVDLNIELSISLHPQEFNFERPAYDVQIHIQDLNLSIDPKQFSDLLDFIKFQNYSKLYDRCREYRELQLQLTSQTTELTLKQKQRLDYLERKLDVFNLAYIRHSVEIELQPQRRASISSQTQNKDWSRWWKPKSTTETSQNNGDFFSEDSPNIDIKIGIDNLVLNLTLPNGNILCPVGITNAQMNFKRRAVSANTLFTVKLQTLLIHGIETDNQTRPLLASSAVRSNSPLIEVEFELSPLDKKSDYRLYLIIGTLRIEYDAPTINKIVSCFDPDDQVTRFPKVKRKQRTIDEMEIDLEQKKIFDMTLKLKGISLFLPENGISYNSSIVHIDLEKLTLKSCLHDHQDDHYLLSKEDVQLLRYYAKYKLRLYNLRITYTRSDRSPFHLIRQLPLLDVNFYKCIYFDDKFLADWRITAMIPRIAQVQLSKSVLKQLIKHAQSVPGLYSDLMETFYRINSYFTIFPPTITVELKFFIRNLYFRLTQYQISIITDISSRISKTRKKKDMKLSLNNLTMSSQTIKSQSICLFYENRSINLVYNNK